MTENRVSVKEEDEIKNDSDSSGSSGPEMVYQAPKSPDISPICIDLTSSSSDEDYKDDEGDEILKKLREKYLEKKKKKLEQQHKRKIKQEKSSQAEGIIKPEKPGCYKKVEEKGKVKEEGEPKDDMIEAIVTCGEKYRFQQETANGFSGLYTQSISTRNAGKFEKKGEILTAKVSEDSATFSGNCWKEGRTPPYFPLCEDISE